MYSLLQLGSDICTSYKYDYCGSAQEGLDLPVKYEEDCYKTCFKPQEKLRLNGSYPRKFRNGFLVNGDFTQ